MNKNLIIFIDSKLYNCEIYRNSNGNEYFRIEGQPVDAKIIFHCDTIGDYVVITEDDDKQRIAWMCQECEV